MRHFVAVVALFVVIFGQTTIVPAAPPEPRVALVIGNSGYKEAPLANPVNDARLMAETLRGLGFEVIERTDADQKAMKLAIFELGDRLEAAGKDAVGLFYYAGHGVQVDGQNYLIPLNAQIEKERHVAIEAVGAGWVLSQMEFAGNRVNFVILDACRNNPLTRGFRSRVRGLAKMDAPTGSLVAYSTGPGDVAADGEEANSPYTLALANAMQTPGLAAEKVFKQVRNTSREKTKNKQTPWEESSMTGADFYFKPAAATPDAAVAGGAAPVESSVIRADTSAMELAFWQSIQDSTDPAMFDEYLQQFPDGTFVGIAKRKRDVLGADAGSETQTAMLVPPPEPALGIEEMDATYLALQTANVRAEPTTQGERRGQLLRDDPITVTGKVEGENWYRIEYEGATAYIYGTLITPVDPGELAAWQSITASTDHTAFRTFLATYPSGHFSERARVKRDLLAPAPEPEPVDLDLAFWDSIAGSDNPADYEAYLAKYPEGHFAGLARARLTAIKETERIEAERQAAEATKRVEEAEAAQKAAERKAAKEAARKEAERKAQQETQTAMLVPPPELVDPISRDEILKSEEIRALIKEFFDAAGVKQKIKFGSEGLQYVRVTMSSIENLKVLEIRENTAIAELEYQWEVPFYPKRRIDTGIATIKKLGASSYEILEF